MDKKFGEIVREIRLKRNIQQQQLAELSGMGQSAISKIESCKSGSPRMITLEKLAKALYVRVSDLTGETDYNDYKPVEDIIETVTSEIIKPNEKIDESIKEQTNTEIQYELEPETGPHDVVQEIPLKIMYAVNRLKDLVKRDLANCYFLGDKKIFIGDKPTQIAKFLVDEMQIDGPEHKFFPWGEKLYHSEQQYQHKDDSIHCIRYGPYGEVFGSLNGVVRHSFYMLGHGTFKPCKKNTDWDIKKYTNDARKWTYKNRISYNKMIHDILSSKPGLLREVGKAIYRDIDKFDKSVSAEEWKELVNKRPMLHLGELSNMHPTMKGWGEISRNDYSAALVDAFFVEDTNESLWFM